MKGIFAIIAVVSFVFLAGCTQYSDQYLGCTNEYKPVCGDNGKTYGNMCLAGMDGAKISHEGECKGGAQQAAGAQTGMPNPASVNCINNGGKLVITKDATGGELGMCTLSDGAICEEWAYMRGECPEPASAKPGAEGMANPASVNCVNNGGTLRIDKDATGAEMGICTLSDGTECEEWAYYRGECKAVGQGGAAPNTIGNQGAAGAPLANPAAGQAAIANPASVNCINNGGILSIVMDQKSNGQIGVCTLPGGVVCEEWAYMRGECPAPANTEGSTGCTGAGCPVMQTGITASQLAAHSERTNCWVAYQGKVYDITAFLPKHVASAAFLEPYCGTSSDFQAAFTGKHGTSKVPVLESEGVYKGELAQ
jgi:putative hemolysin